MISRKFAALVSMTILSIASQVDAVPTHDSWFNRRHEEPPRDVTSFQKQNGLDAQKQNAQFATFKETDSCDANSMGCVNGAFAQCLSGKWALSACPSGTTCVALPLVNRAGTSIACDSQTDALARFTAAGVTGGLDGKGTTSNNTTTTDDSTNGDGEDCEADDEADGGDDEDCEDDDNLDEPTSTSAAAAAPSSSANADSGAYYYRRVFGRQISVTFPVAVPATIATPTSIASSTSAILSPSFTSVLVSQTSVNPITTSPSPTVSLPPQATATIDDSSVSGTQPVTETGLPNTVVVTVTPSAVSTASTSVVTAPATAVVTVTQTVTVGCQASSSSVVPPSSTVTFPSAASSSAVSISATPASSSVGSTPTAVISSSVSVPAASSATIASPTFAQGANGARVNGPVSTVTGSAIPSAPPASSEGSY